jgi:hypothetical protein
VVISYLLGGQGSTVAWTLQPSFTLPRPYEFTLQVSQANNPNADDWEPVGLPVENVFTAVDPVQRLFGLNRWLFYRVKLVADGQTFYSDPTGLEGTLSRWDWNQARMAMRQEIIAMKNGDGELGYLLKRRIAGPRCPRCTDSLTGDVTDGRCPICSGTGFTCGYFFPIACVWADISPKARHLTLDPNRGTVGDTVVSARILNPWMLSEEDIFVSKVSDDRYYIHRVADTYTFRGVPIAANVELRLAPVSDCAYTFVIPEQALTPLAMATMLR